jgi:hypothetical protein
MNLTVFVDIFCRYVLSIFFVHILEVARKTLQHRQSDPVSTCQEKEKNRRCKVRFPVKANSAEKCWIIYGDTLNSLWGQVGREGGARSHASVLLLDSKLLRFGNDIMRHNFSSNFFKKHDFHFAKKLMFRCRQKSPAQKRPIMYLNIDSRGHHRHF